MEFSFFTSGSPVARTDRHRIAGTVTVDGLPARRIVSMFDRRSMTWIASTISNPATGAWVLSGLPEYPERVLAVIAWDHTGNYNAEIADFISQVTA